MDRLLEIALIFISFSQIIMRIGIFRPNRNRDFEVANTNALSHVTKSPDFML